MRKLNIFFTLTALFILNPPTCSCYYTLKEMKLSFDDQKKKVGDSVSKQLEKIKVPSFSRNKSQKPKKLSTQTMEQLDKLGTFKKCYTLFTNTLVESTGCMDINPTEICFDHYLEQAQNLDTATSMSNNLKGFQETCPEILQHAQESKKDFVHIKNKQEKKQVTSCLYEINQLLKLRKNFPKQWPGNDIKGLSILREFMKGYIGYMRDNCADIRFDITKM